MDIWIINHYADPPSKPGGTRHISLATELVRRGHRVSLFASSFNHGTRSAHTGVRPDLLQWEEIGGAKIGWLSSPSYSDDKFGRAWNMLVFASRVLQLPNLCRTPPDVVYGSTPTLFAALAGLIVARHFGVPFVLEIRDIWPQTLIDMGMSHLHPFVVGSWVVERYLYQHANAIVSLLPDAAPHLVAHGAARERIYWIPNGVSFDLAPSVVPPQPKEVLEVMYAGACRGGNDPELLLKAAARLRQRGGPALRFRILGNGSGEAALIAKRDALELTNVAFEPAVPKRQVYSLLSQADILVAPYLSLGVHRFGVSLNKLFDYMAAARPIVFSGQSSNHPVRDAGCGLECPPDDPDAFADAIAAIAKMSSQERWEMGLRGRRYVEQNHDFARLTARLEAILAGAVSKSQSALLAPQLEP